MSKKRECPKCNKLTAQVVQYCDEWGRKTTRNLECQCGYNAYMEHLAATTPPMEAPRD